MDKEINPALAGLIVALFLVPIGIWVWAAGESGEARVGSFYLEKDASGHLSIQADQLVVTQETSNRDADVFDLAQYGMSDLMGNITYLPDNEFIVRTGGSNWNPVTAMTMAESRDPNHQIIRQKLSKHTQEHASLAKCNRPKKACTPYLGLTAPWRHRLYFDSQAKALFITEGTNHTIKKFNQDGQNSGLLDRDLKFPKRIRAYEDHYYLADTNNHRILFFEGSNDEFGKTRSEMHVKPPSGPNIWTLDALRFGEHWWVINAGHRMQNAKLYRFDSNGKFAEEISLPESAEPFDLLVWQNKLLVSDLTEGSIYRFDKMGHQISELKSPAIKRYFDAVSSRRYFYESLIAYSQIGFGVLFVAGLAIAIVIGRKHDKANPKQKSFNQIPPYLSTGFKVQQPNSILNNKKEVKVNNILISNIEIVPGKRIKDHLGLVQGSTVRAKHAGKDIMAGLKNIFGGELSSYTDLLSESRQEAIERMSEQAQAIGANAVINVRFSTSSITAGASEILAYGTAVLLEEK